MLLGMLGLIFEGFLTVSSLLLVPTSRFAFSPNALRGGGEPSLFYVGEGDHAVHGHEQVLDRPGWTNVPSLTFEGDDSDSEDDEWDIGGDEPKIGPSLLKTQLDVNKDITIFSAYIRDFMDFSSRFQDGDSYSVILAPSNEAITKLSAKPWEYPIPVRGDDQEQDKCIQRNIRTFLEAHMYFGTISGVALCPDDADSTCFITEGGVPIKIQQRGNTMVVKSLIDGTQAKVLSTKEVKNGVIWVIDTALLRPHV